MTLATDLHGYLTRRVDLAALVDGRIFVSSVPAGVSMPYLVIQQISLDSDSNMAAASGLYTAGWQCDCYAESVATCDEMAETLRQCLDGYQTDDFPTVTLEAITLEGDRMSASYDRQGELNYTQRRSIDITIWYQTSVPTFPAA